MVMEGPIQRLMWTALLVAGSLVAGCGENAEEPEITAEILTARGWDQFEAGNFVSALSNFHQAIAKDSDYADAYNGCGWSELGLDSLAVAITDFDQSLAKGISTPDPFGGKAIAYRDPEELDPGFDIASQDSIRGLAIVCADSVLSRDVRYVFSHDSTFNWQDLRLIMAQSYWHLSQYDEAKVQVDSLNPENLLNLASVTFVEDLMVEIQRLGDEIAGF